MNFEGVNYYDTWCLGAGDVHITVCMDDQPFQYVTTQNNVYRAQYTPSAAFWSDVQGVIGLGTYPQEEDDKWSFINNAYESGLI